MAVKKVSELAADPNTLLTVPAAGDFVLIYDLSESIEARKIKAIAFDNLVNFAQYRLVASQASGDLFYGSSASAIARLAKAAANGALRMNAAGTLPIWRDLVYSEASNAAPATNADLYSKHLITALAANTVIGAPTGTPVNGQSLVYRLKDNGSARTIGWNAVFRGVGCTLPSTTVAGKTLYVGFFYNAEASKWDCPAALAQET